MIPDIYDYETLTEEQAKSINGKEVMYKSRTLKRAYHAVVLSKEGVGTSVKPYFVDAYEKRNYIKERAKNNKKSYQEIKEEVEAPNFCFLFGHPEVPFKRIKELIEIMEKGEIIPGELTQKGTPECPFY